jgi:hypothetical protein
MTTTERPLVPIVRASAPPAATGFLRLRAEPLAGALPAGLTAADLPAAVVTGVKISMGGRSSGNRQTKAALAAVGLELAPLN